MVPLCQRQRLDTADDDSIDANDNDPVAVLPEDLLHDSSKASCELSPPPLSADATHVGRGSNLILVSLRFLNREWE